MRIGRQKFGAAALNGKIYVCGGTDESDECCFNSVEVYDPIKDRYLFL